jgi:asparagine synthase (glutamine-hydrolysing)
MCGFAGLFTNGHHTADDLDGQVGRMIAPIAHRGPDDAATWTDHTAGVALGFRRLAILDLSPTGRQPMRSQSGRYVVTFNGEIYNFDALRRQLEALGHRFRGSSDTEVLLGAFDQWGIVEGVTRSVGMFAIAVWDAERREITLVRDRLGKKPLYVYQEPGLVTFGSELKALIAGPSFDREIDDEALKSYLRYLYVPAPRTMFRRAIKVPAGHVLTVSDPRGPLPAPTPYWSVRDAARAGLADPFTGTETEALDELDRLLREAVRCRLHSDVPLGALLSGGIDSSTVVALMREVATGPVKTYTIGFSEAGFDEARHAARVARHLGTEHTELFLTGDDVQGLVRRLPEIFDEPLADPSQLPTLLVSELARRQVTVALSGDGGDEVFAGYNRYVYGSRMLPRLHRLPRAVRVPVAAGLGRVSSRTWNWMRSLTPPVLAGAPSGHFGERIHKLGHVMHASSVIDMYRSLLSAGWQRPEELLAPDHRGAGPVADAAADGGEPVNLLDRMMLMDQLTYLPDDLLAKLDRTSMAVSLEVRSPLLDHRVVEFSWRMPRALKLRGSTGKWALRQLLYRRVPPELVERPKMGFSVPIDRWLRGPLRRWADDLLSDDAIRRGGVLDRGAVSRAWAGLKNGESSTGLSLWSLVMFQAWRARWQS